MLALVLALGVCSCPVYWIPSVDKTLLEQASSFSNPWLLWETWEIWTLEMSEIMKYIIVICVFSDDTCHLALLDALSLNSHPNSCSVTWTALLEALEWVRPPCLYPCASWTWQRLWDLLQKCFKKVAIIIMILMRSLIVRKCKSRIVQ